MKTAHCKPFCEEIFNFATYLSTLAAGGCKGARRQSTTYMKYLVYYILSLMFWLVPATLFAQRGAGGSAAQGLVKEGIACMRENNLPQALNCFTKAVQQAEAESDEKSQVRALGYIGTVYFSCDEYERSLRYMHRGYDLAVQLGFTDLQKHFLSNIVGAYCRLGDVKQAERYFQKQQELVQDDTTDVFLLYNKARVLRLRGDRTQALKVHERLIGVLQQHGDKGMLLACQYCEMGLIYLELQKGEQALACAESCLQNAEARANQGFLVTVYRLFSEAYHLLGNEQQAEEYKHRCLSLADSVFNRKGLARATATLANYEDDQQNAFTGRLRHTITRQWWVIVLCVSLIAALCVAVVMVIRTNRRLRQAHRAVVEANRRVFQSDVRYRDLRDQVAEALPELTPAVQQSEPARVPAAADAAATAEVEPHTDAAAIHDSHDDQQWPIIKYKLERALCDMKLIGNPDFNVNMLAEYVGTNQKYVSMIINETYGKNFRMLINEIRVREACRLLSDTEHYGNHTIQAIYQDVGYTSSASFIRAFRRINGMTPSEYQKAATEKETDAEME